MELTQSFCTQYIAAALIVGAVMMGCLLGCILTREEGEHQWVGGYAKILLFAMAVLFLSILFPLPVQLAFGVAVGVTLVETIGILIPVAVRVIDACDFWLFSFTDWISGLRDRARMRRHRREIDRLFSEQTR